MQPVVAGYAIERLSGPVVVASILNWGLFGTLSVQLYLYYLAFPKDRSSIKYLVYGIYAAEFGQTMLVTYDVFLVFGYGFGDMKALTGMHSNWLSIPVTSAVVAYVGQGFYAYRIFVLSRSRTVPAFVICVSLTSSVAGIIAGVYSFQAEDITKLGNRKTFITFGIWCGASALCDIIIAICMTYYLMRSNTGFRHTRMLITKLIRLTIETGSVTAVVALLTFILFYAFPHDAFYGVPAVMMTKLYANTLYVMLNSRIRIMGGRDTYTSSTDISFTATLTRDIEGTRPAGDDYETSCTDRGQITPGRRTFTV
ncbi:hypothetical protein IW261DRAFT_801361 [Armillaria novae-zelandiae]|uniref:DUF6534 domain-containing protein n=1 Tax=Armillaria novae-zelandiae TaxID=153914 RepID=A0AA39TFR2_9AGAR|nr:hypothetical protein IW261DRAFT_801361 [Armillaria novae-zelandiae]